MEGTWDKLGPLLLVEKDGEIVVSRDKLHALKWTCKIMLAYDPKTPESVVAELKYDPFQTVVRAAFQRPDVLAGRLLNPFKTGACDGKLDLELALDAGAGLGKS